MNFSAGALQIGQNSGAVSPSCTYPHTLHTNLAIVIFPPYSMLIEYILQHPKQNVNAFALFLSQVYPIVYHLVDNHLPCLNKRWHLHTIAFLIMTYFYVETTHLQH